MKDKVGLQLSNYDFGAEAFNYFTLELMSQLGIMHKAQKSSAICSRQRWSKDFYKGSNLGKVIAALARYRK